MAWKNKQNGKIYEFRFKKAHGFSRGSMSNHFH